MAQVSRSRSGDVSLGDVPVLVERKSGAFFRLVKCTTNTPPCRAPPEEYGKRIKEDARAQELANTPRWCGCVLASTDPAALDVTLCRLFSLDPDEHRFAAEAAERGLGTNDPASITTVGTSLDEARIAVRRPRRGWDYYPFNVIVGGGVTYAGTLGHWKSIADAFLRDGTWVKVMAARGVPNFLIGDAEDPDFERHVTQGPYFVIDDVAPARYRLDPRVHVIMGHPALHNMLPELLRGLGLTVPGGLTHRVQQWMRVAESRLLYVPLAQTLRDTARRGLVLVGVGTVGLMVLRALLRKQTD
jgi:hypothetical protein